MDYPITKRLPCSVCGLVTFRHDGWFLVIENRWLDRLKILTWHSSLASQKGFNSACSRQHLKVLIAFWLDQASLRLPPQPDNTPMPLAGTPASTRLDRDFDSHCAARLVGELSVHRETFSKSWSGSPATLESILDALIPVTADPHPTEFQLFDAGSKSSPGPISSGLALH